MAKPYYDSWKNITVIMKDKTNDGMGKVNNPLPYYRLKNDKRFYPIGLDADGKGIILKSSKTVDDDMSLLGILMESFNKPGIEHQVLVKGIVPMKLEKDLAGKQSQVLYLSATEGLVTPDKPTATAVIPVGRALEVGKANEYIAVLVGMV